MFDIYGTRRRSTAHPARNVSSTIDEAADLIRTSVPEVRRLFHQSVSYSGDFCWWFQLRHVKLSALSAAYSGLKHSLEAQ